jgi:hypothetical protein
VQENDGNKACCKGGRKKEIKSALIQKSEPFGSLFFALNDSPPDIKEALQARYRRRTDKYTEKMKGADSRTNRNS